MDPEEMKQKLAEADAKIAAKLGELGFTPEEIQRQFDPNVPTEVKEAERERVLTRKFVSDLNDPSSGLLEKIAASITPEQIEAEVQRAMAERAARRKRMIIGGVLAAAAVGLGVWYFVLRDTRSTCEKIAGSAAEIEKLLGQPVQPGYTYNGKYSCNKTFKGGGRDSLVELNFEEAHYSSAPDAKKFGEIKTIDLGTRKAIVYLAAADVKEVSPDELYRDAVKRAEGPSYMGKDPMGDALAALPSTRHVALVPVGDHDLRVSFDRSIALEQIQAYLTAVLARL